MAGFYQQQALINQQAVILGLVGGILLIANRHYSQILLVKLGFLMLYLANIISKLIPIMVIAGCESVSLATVIKAAIVGDILLVCRNLSGRFYQSSNSGALCA